MLCHPETRLDLPGVAVPQERDLDLITHLQAFKLLFGYEHTCGRAERPYFGLEYVVQIITDYNVLYE